MLSPACGPALSTSSSGRLRRARCASTFSEARSVHWAFSTSSASGRSAVIVSTCSATERAVLGHGRVEVAERDVAEQVAQGEVRDVALVLAARGAAQRPALSGRGEQQGSWGGHATTLRPRAGRRNSRDPESLEVRGELRTGLDAELRVRVGEVRLDRVDGHEQGLRDLLVRCGPRRPGARPGARSAVSSPACAACARRRA